MATRPIAVVTASASGIGREIARVLVRDGYRTIVSDIDVVRGQATAAGLSAEFRACDVRKPDQVEALNDGVNAEFLGTADNSREPDQHRTQEAYQAD